MLVERGVHHTEFPEFDIFDPEFHGEQMGLESHKRISWLLQPCSQGCLCPFHHCLPSLMESLVKLCICQQDKLCPAQPLIYTSSDMMIMMLMTNITNVGWDDDAGDQHWWCWPFPPVCSGSCKQQRQAPIHAPLKRLPCS